jgi:diguanylate cyclase (GGDEF)-like protein/PAS domain S-box-containing protein
MKGQGISYSTRQLTETMAVAALYIGTARLGFLIAVPPGNISPIWAPSGIALAAVLLLGTRAWVGIWLGSFIANAWFFLQITNPFSIAPLATASSIGAGSTFQALLGAFLIQRFVKSPIVIDRPRDVFKFTGIEALCCTVASTFGVTSLCLAGFAGWEAYAYSWWTWWAGDLVGVLVVTPLVTAWNIQLKTRLNPWRSAEGLLLLFLMFAAGLIIFGGEFSSGNTHYPLEYVLIIFLMWAAFRFGQSGGALSILVISGMAIWGTVNGYGPFVRKPPDESFLLLQIFVAVVSVTGLALTATISKQKKMEEALRESEERYRSLVELSPDTIIALSKEKVVYVNPAGLKLFGAGRPEEFVGKSIMDFIHPEHEALAKKQIRYWIQKTNRLKLEEYKCVRLDGQVIHVEAIASPILYQGKAGALSFVRDITQRKRVERSLRYYNERLKILHEIDRSILAAQSSEAIARATLHHLRQLVPCNRATVILFDFETHEAEVLAADITGETQKGVGARLPLEGLDMSGLGLLKEGKVCIIEDISNLPDPVPVLKTLKEEGIQSYLNVPLISQGGLIGSLNLGRNTSGTFIPEHVDISREVADLLAVAIQQARLLEQVQKHSLELQYQATHDPLTGLPNRILLRDRLEQAIIAGRRENESAALLIMDLDHFKEVNDTLGHLYGDAVLKEIGPRLRDVMRAIDTLARLAGDEFVALLPRTDINGARNAAQKIIKALGKPFILEGKVFNVSASIGIALFPEHAADADTLLRLADVAMYTAKQANSGYTVYH